MGWGTATRRGVKNGLTRLPPSLRNPLGRGLLRGYEAGVAARGLLGERSREPEDLPLPPARLRVMVVGHADPAPFLDQGRRHNEIVRGALSRAAFDSASAGRLLDWGCGCGRVLRWWSDLPATEVHGCDYSPKLVRWVNRNLPFAEARMNSMRPPLPYETGAFDFAYAISVVTHLPDDFASAWMTEIARVLRPGGLFFFTTQGLAYRDRLRPADATRFDAGESVVLFPAAEGTNLCASYHPARWIRGRLAESRLELVELCEAHRLPTDRLDGLLQDRWLVRKSP